MRIQNFLGEQGISVKSNCSPLCNEIMKILVNDLKQPCVLSLASYIFVLCHHLNTVLVGRDKNLVECIHSKGRFFLCFYQKLLLVITEQSPGRVGVQSGGNSLLLLLLHILFWGKAEM